VKAESVPNSKLEEYNSAMVELHLSTLDLTRTRFAYSPLWETVMGYRAMLEPSRFAIHLPWLCEARELTRELNLEPLDVLTRPKGYIPDFMTPPPVTPLPDFADELRVLLATDAKTVRHEVAKTYEDQPNLPEAAQAFLDDPHGSLERLAESVQTFWTLTLEPHWPRLRAMLENDILIRARSLALGGADELFRDLNPLIRYTDGVLRLDKSMCNDWRDRIELDGRGLLLMPSAFVWPKLSMILDAPWQPTLAYTPRGVANLWTNEPPSAGRSLELLLGKGRAEVLLSLDPPSSTLEIAHRLKLASSGVSEHLGVLRQAGLVESQRRGRFVYYRLSQTGLALLEVFNTSMTDALELELS
jgi:DNA-binding transcriptional ArsR family regulator